MPKHKNKPDRSNHVGLILLGLVGLGVCVTLLLQGVDVALFNPKGLIADEQHRLMILSAVVLLAIGVPTLTVLYFFAWKYRESNQTATYAPQARHGKFYIFSIWAAPTSVMLVLALVMWPATHRLAPQKQIATGTQPITIQVIAMRWKWLFIYPEQNIATVNFVQIPINTPVKFELTADETPMSSFWIPHLGGQLYAMTGHQNQLNLIADTPGDFPGRTAEINGAGFADMKFVTRASSKQDFDLWVRSIKLSTSVLDSAMYQSLLSPSQNNSVAVYSRADTDLYGNLRMKYSGPHNNHAGIE